MSNPRKQPHRKEILQGTPPQDSSYWDTLCPPTKAFETEDLQESWTQPRFPTTEETNDEEFHLTRLNELVINPEALCKNGYVTNPLSESELLQKRKCINCGRSVAFKKVNRFRDTYDQLQNDQNSQISRAMKPAPKICKYHRGSRLQGLWSCCGKSYFKAPGCQEDISHLPRVYGKDELESLYQCYLTPFNANKKYRRAVALDCEMGVSANNDSELIRVTVVDYFTSETLVDNLVYPIVPMLHLNTRFSGVTWTQLNQAKSRQSCFFGRDAAREEIWNHVGPQTIVIMHSGNHDLKSLRWVHHNVVDTFAIENAIFLSKQRRKAEAEMTPKLIATELRESQCLLAPEDEDEKDMTAIEHKEKKKQKTRKGEGPLCLKTLTMKRVKRSIQQGKQGHDSLQDALATRDVAKWHVINVVDLDNDD